MGEILIGTAGWSYPDWKGRVYPPRPGSRFDSLAYLADYFDLIEVNASFYSLPRPETVRSWLARTAHVPGFQFILKAPGAWTHPRQNFRPAPVPAFRELAELMAAEGRLAAVLVQFPWSFRHADDSRNRIDELRDSLEGLPLAVEVRHGSFADGVWPRWLLSRSCLPVNIDQPPVGEGLGLTDWSAPGGAYFRLHGRNEANWFDESAGRDGRYDYLYGPEELSSLGDAIQRTMDTSERVLVVANNHFLGQAVVNALQLKARFAGGPIAVPAALIPHYPALAEIALPELGGQGDLFSG